MAILDRYFQETTEIASSFIKTIGMHQVAKGKICLPCELEGMLPLIEALLRVAKYNGNSTAQELYNEASTRSSQRTFETIDDLVKATVTYRPIVDIAYNHLDS